MRGERLWRQGASERATTMTRSELRWRRASIGVFLVWFWYKGSILGFFFFDKHLCIGVCFAFALYRLYWGLVFSAFSASDVTVGLIYDSLGWFFFFLKIRGWVCFVGLAVGLALLQFFFSFFQILVQFFWGFFFFLLESWIDKFWLGSVTIFFKNRF